MNSETPQLFVGIDIGKNAHVAGLISAALLREKTRFKNCPTLKFEQSRSGLNALLKFIATQNIEASRTAILLEQTGHYHRALQEHLQTEGFLCYIIAVHRKRQTGIDKTDKADALRLANLLYSQLALGAQMDDPTQRIERRLPPIPVAAAVAPFIRMHYELTQQATRTRNRLTAIADETFPELTLALSDPNGGYALSLRERFPTPALVANASLDDLRAFRSGRQPSDKQIQRLQELAKQSIGIKDAQRLRGLLLEQRQLLESFRLYDRQLSAVDLEICRLIAASREGQILLSIPMIGYLHAAAILAAIGNIRNFERAAHLRRFAGWSPQAFQSGSSFDGDDQTGTGSRLLKHHLYLIALNAIKAEPWKSFYARLVQRKCSYDARTKKHRGKMKVVGRLAGTITTMIFAFLKEDARIVDAVPDGEALPEPMLYDPTVHEAHRRGARLLASNRDV